MTTKLTEVSDGFQTDVDPTTFPLTSGVSSVNTKSGAVTLNTDDIGEGSTNQYFTPERAKAAAVTDSVTSGETETAPSVRAVKEDIWVRSLGSKTSDYTLTKLDYFIDFDATSGELTATLPTTSQCTGRTYVIRKSDSTFNTVSITSTDPIIGGASMTTRKLATQGETIHVYCTGDSWIIVHRFIPSIPTTYTPTLSAGWGVATLINFFWQRIGGAAQVWGDFTLGTGSASSASITLPGGITTSPLIPRTVVVGEAFIPGQSTTYFSTSVIADPNSNLIYFGRQGSTMNALTKQNVSSIANSSQQFNLKFLVPITDWDK